MSKIVVKCQQCGKEFETWENWIKRGGGKFCSRSCSAKSRTGNRNSKYNGTIIIHCKMCNEEIKTSPGKRRVFCSRECKDKWQSVYIVGKNHFSYRRIELICEWCKNPFEAKLHKKNKRFCSNPCKNKWFAEFSRKLQTKPDKQRFYPLTFNREFRTMIRKRDKFTCLLCGKNGYDVHHIDYDKNNTTPENCITLCKRCHPKTNHNREYWKLKIQGMINERNKNTN